MAVGLVDCAEAIDVQGQNRHLVAESVGELLSGFDGELERVLKIDRARDCERGGADGEAARKAGSF